jgi:glycopeptide antibiotics resistance protein
MRKAIVEIVDMSWPTIVIVVCILAIMRIAMLFKGERKKFVFHEEIFNLLFIVYLMVLFRLVTSQDLPGGGTNLTPFREILRYDYGTNGFYKQVFGNILLFIPLGYFLTKYCRIKRLGGIILTSLLSSLSIEVVQHFIGRSFDIDDVILNVAGGIIGFLIFIALDAIKDHLPGFMRKNWFYDILTILLLLAGILFLVKIL